MVAAKCLSNLVWPTMIITLTCAVSTRSARLYTNGMPLRPQLNGYIAAFAINAPRVSVYVPTYDIYESMAAATIRRKNFDGGDFDDDARQTWRYFKIRRQIRTRAERRAGSVRPQYDLSSYVMSACLWKNMATASAWRRKSNEM